MDRTHLVKNRLGAVFFEYNIQTQKLWFISEKEYTKIQYTAEGLKSFGWILEEINPQLENE